MPELIIHTLPNINNLGADVAGINFSGRSYWLPGQNGSEIVTHTFEPDVELAMRICNYFDKYYIREPDRERNCHIGAAALSLGKFFTYEVAEGIAGLSISTGNRVDSLAPGQWGVIGALTYDDLGVDLLPEILVKHSIVGVANNRVLHTDGYLGPLSISSTPDVMNFYSTPASNTNLFLAS